MFQLPILGRGSWPVRQLQPCSAQLAARTSRLRCATVTPGVYPYCAVGGGQLVYTKGGQLADVEGRPAQPHQRGHALSQGGQCFGSQEAVHGGAGRGLRRE